MEEIVIIGAGDGGRIVSKLIKQQNMFKILGFIDDKNNLKGRIVGSCKVIGTTRDLKKFKGTGFVIAIGSNMKNRKFIFSQAVKAGLKQVNVIDKSAMIDKTAKIGEGTIVLARCIIGAYTRMGDNNFLFTETLIEHDSQIGSNVFFGPRVTLAGRISIGDDSFLGINSCVVEGVRIGSNVIVGAGAVVIKDVMDDMVVAGVPAKKIKSNE